MEYLNKRGGRIILTNISAPEKQDWGTAQEAMTSALELEKHVNEVKIQKGCFSQLIIFFYQNLLKLHSVASGHMDVNLCDFLETNYLQEQVDVIKEIADHITNLERVGEGLGVFMFDQQLKE